MNVASCLTCFPRFSRILFVLGLLLSFSFSARSQTENLVGTPYSLLGASTPIAAVNGSNVAIDSKDNVYYPDIYKNTINKIDLQGNVTLVPTTGLSSPQGMRFDASDNLYVCDALNSRIVVVSAADVQTVLPMTGLSQPRYLAFDPGYQNLYVSDRYAGILQYNLASQKTTVYATNLFRPEGIVVDSKGNLYYGDGGTLVKNGVSLSTAFGSPNGLIFDKAGNLYIEGDGLFRMDPSGNVLQLADESTNDIAIDSHGILTMPSHNEQQMLVYMAGPAVWGGRNEAFVGGRIYYNYANPLRAYYSTPSGVTLSSLTIPSPGSPYGGDDSPSCFTATLCGANMSLGAFLPGPQPGYAVATFSDGTKITTPLYGSGVQVEMGFSPGMTTQITTGVGGYQGAASDLNGSVYVSDGVASTVLKITGTTITPVSFTGVNAPAQVAVDGTNAVYVHDNFVGADRIVKLDSSGKQTVPWDLSQQDASLPHLTGLGSFAVDGATNLYVVGGLEDGKTTVIEMYGANGVNSVYAKPQTDVTAMAFDTFGTLYAAESGALVKFDHFGNRVLVAGGLDLISSLAIEPSGTVYFKEFAHAQLMKIPPGGVPTSYQVPGVQVASFVTIDNYGNLFICDNVTLLLTFNDRTTQPYAFGDVAVSASSTLHNSLVNVGSQSGLTISGITGGGPFVLDPNTTTCVPGTTSLAAGGTCDIGFTFTPNAVQDFSNTGQVVIPLPTPFYSATVASLPLTGSGVSAPPVANPGGPYIGTAGSPVSFTGSASTDPKNEPLTYAWSFGDNSSGTGATPTHLYTAAGTYTVTLTVTNADGVTNSAETTATIAQSYIVTATPAAIVLGFAPAAVAATPTVSQTMTASFTVTGYAGTFLPIAKLHYGLSYTLGAVTCTGSGTETCTIPVTFKPLYPGGRRDAIFLMNGSTRLATMLLSGVGQGPLSLLGPGLLTTPHTDPNLYFYKSVVDENGTDYVVSGAQSVVTSITAAGVATQLPIPVYEPQSIAIDGAGVLYVSDLSSKPYAGAPSISVKTYDTVTGVQGSMTNPDGVFYITALALGDNGTLFETDQNNIFELSEYGGASTTIPISPDPVQTTGFIVDSNGNLFFGGDYSQNELTAGGTQTQINKMQALYGYVIDAADTLYAGRFSRTENVGMLPASNAWSAGIGPDLAPNTSPLGLGIGGDGTLWVGNYNSLDKVDRSQGAFTFDATNPGQVADPQTAYLYNGGNQPLILTSFALSGDPNYTLSSPVSDVACAAGSSIPAGGLCAVVVNFTAPGHGGIFNGTLTFTTNSLNTVTNQVVTLTDPVTGSYLVPSPASLIFGNETLNTTSAPMSVTFTNNGYNASGNITSMTSSNSAFTAGVLPSACNSIAVGGSCTVGVTFNPVTSGSTSGTLTFSGNAPDAVVNVTGTVNAPPAASLTPASYSFGDVETGSSATMVFKLANIGTGSLDIGTVGLAVEATNSYSATNNCTTLAAGASCAITVTFKPSTGGPIPTTLTIKDAAGTQAAAISGTGIAPTATLTPATYDFGSVAVGASRTTVFSLTNTSPVSIAVGTIVLAPESTGSYSYTKTCGATLAANASCTFTVTFKPTAGGSSATTLNVNDDAGRQTAGITGNGLAPVATLTPATYNFGNVAVGLSKTSVFTLTNPGAGSIGVGTIVLAPESTGSYSYTKTCGATLAANASCTFTVTFKPTVGGSSATTLNVTDDTGTQKATLTGSGVAPTATLLPASYDFGTLPVGGTASKDFILTNTSLVPINITAIVPPTASDFSRETNCPSPLAAGASCTITVTFAPTVGGATGSSISVKDDAGTQNAGFTGKYQVPTATLTPATYAFGNLTVGASAQAVFTLTNSSTIPMKFGDVETATDATRSYSASTNCPAKIAGGASCSVTLTFVPAISEPINTILYVNDDAGQQSVSVTGAGAKPTATLTPATYDYGSLVVGSFLNGVFTLTNTSTAPIKIGTRTLAKEATNSYTLGDMCPSTLAAGASCTFVVAYEPRSIGRTSTTLTITDDAGTQMVSVSGTATLPVAILTPASGIFAAVGIGASDTRTFLLQNKSNVTLNLSIALAKEATGSYSQTSTCASSLLAGQTCSITVQFAPTAVAAAINTILTVTDEAGVQSVAITGTGVTGLTVSSPAPYQDLYTPAPGDTPISNVPIGDSVTEAFTVTNVSGSPYPANFALTGPDAAFFSIRGCAVTLAPQEVCQLLVTFNPANDVFYNATVIGAAPTLITSIPLVAYGTPGPVIKLVDPIPSPLNGDWLVSTTRKQYYQVTNRTPYDLYNIAPGIQNIEGASSTDDGISLDYDVGNTCYDGRSLGKGDSCYVLVDYTPTHTGPSTAYLGVVTTPFFLPVSVSSLVTISGNGIVPNVQLSPTQLNFGNVFVGVSSVLTTTFRNTGSAPVLVTSLNFSGPGASAYSASSQCGAVVAPQGSCVVSITLDTSKVGSFNATLTFVDSDPPGTQSITLSGSVSTAAQARFNVTSLDFGKTPLGATSHQMLTLSNPGSAALAITSAATSSAAYTVSGDTCGKSLSAGAFCTYTLNFTPTVLGPVAGSFTLNTAIGSFPVALTGTATGVYFTVSPVTTDFGSMPAGTMVSRNILISNVTSSALDYALVKKSGDMQAFAFTGCPSPIAANSTCTLTVAYSASLGNSALDVTLNTGAAVYTEFYVTGSGTQPFVVTPSTYNFGNVNVGTSASTTFTLTNTASVDLKAGAISLESFDAVSLISETSDCPTLLSAGGSCHIKVTVAPSSNTDFPYAVLSIPTQSGTLETKIFATGYYPGTDFSLTTDAVYRTLSTNTPATFNLDLQSLVPKEAFPYPVTLSYSGQLPAGYTASFSPATLTPNSAVVTSVLTIVSDQQKPPGFLGQSRPRPSKLPVPLACSLLGLAFLARKRLRRGAFALLLCLGLTAGAAGLSGCGAGTNNNYQGTITATGNGITHSVNVVLSQNP